MKKAFNAIDDWSYGYIDASNLKRFLVSMGYRHPSAHKKGWKKALQLFLHAVIRRFDLTGDSRISFEEFKDSIMPKSYESLSGFNTQRTELETEKPSVG